MSNHVNEQIMERAMEAALELGGSYVIQVERLILEGDIEGLWWLLKTELVPLVNADRTLNARHKRLSKRFSTDA